jgi:hypothetical protein
MVSGSASVRACWARLGGSGSTRWVVGSVGSLNNGRHGLNGLHAAGCRLQAEVGLVGPCFAQAAPGCKHGDDRNRRPS